MLYGAQPGDTKPSTSREKAVCWCSTALNRSLNHLIIVQDSRHQARSTIAWILSVDGIAQVQDKQVADSRGVLCIKTKSESDDAMNLDLDEL